ncbi:MAG: hypothetical protein GC172_05480 [Phycisphaera sp.]|nr:hypothetical protein [Phycisphaera sp.]
MASGHEQAPRGRRAAPIFVASDAPEAALLREFPQLTHENVLECLAFAAERERRIVIDPAA